MNNLIALILMLITFPASSQTMIHDYFPNTDKSFKPENILNELDDQIRYWWNWVHHQFMKRWPVRRDPVAVMNYHFIYPDPTILTMDVIDFLEDHSLNLEIYNSQGLLAKSQTVFGLGAINEIIEDMNPGMYHLRLWNTRADYSTKFIRY